MTRSGVEYDLHKSPFVLTRRYTDKSIKFVFSSRNKLLKFEEKTLDNDVVIKERGMRVFRKCHVSHDVCDVLLYNSVESRGFLIFIDDKEHTSLPLSKVTLHG